MDIPQKEYINEVFPHSKVQSHIHQFQSHQSQNYPSYRYEIPFIFGLYRLQNTREQQQQQQPQWL
jgi:hypothetical protein